MLNYLEKFLCLPQDTISSSLSLLTSLAPATSKPVALPPPTPIVMNRILSSSPWVQVAALSGACAVGLGAYGAHALKASPEKRAIFETANKYHFYHSIALLLTPLLKRTNLVFYCSVFNAKFFRKNNLFFH